MNDQINQVSDTAFMAAAYRAMETNHPNAIFHDPLAAKLAGDRGKKIIDSLPKQAFIGGWSVVIRTRIIDDFIQGAIVEGVDTILNLGAGLDTRPYRMALPESLRWIEVDYPHVIELKETHLSGETPRCRLERVRLDLADVDARRTLLDKVAAQSKKILVLTEAVTPYLSEEAVASLGADLGSHESIGYWIVDYFSPASYEYRRRSGMSKSMQKAPFLFVKPRGQVLHCAIRPGVKHHTSLATSQLNIFLIATAPFLYTVTASNSSPNQMLQYRDFLYFSIRILPADSAHEL